MATIFPKDVQSIAIKKIDTKSTELYQLSQEIWSHPELCYEEHFAHKTLTDFLEREAFNVERNFIHATGFRATFGDDDGVHVCVICEYDALPEIGHGCGHNLIAECGVAAGLGLKAALEIIGCGKVTILGTPAEEGGGGKLAMIEANTFATVDVAMMAHPCPHNIAQPPLLAKQDMMITYQGKPAHAAAFPWEGKNALDAAVICYQSISVMRQQMKPDWRIHGIITNGGVAPNIIPEKAEMHYYLRAPTRKEVEELMEIVEGCIEGAASATGCKADSNMILCMKWKHPSFPEGNLARAKQEVNYEYTGSYMDLVSNSHLAALYERHATDLGLEFTRDESVMRDQAASGDIGNVSQVVPTIQPGYSIHTEAGNHTKEFAQATVCASAHQATLTQAKALALTALDLLIPGNNKTLLHEIQQEFRDTFARRGSRIKPAQT